MDDNPQIVISLDVGSNGIEVVVSVFDIKMVLETNSMNGTSSLGHILDHLVDFVGFHLVSTS